MLSPYSGWSNCGLGKDLAITGQVSTNILEPITSKLFDCGLEEFGDDAPLGENYKFFLNVDWNFEVPCPAYCDTVLCYSKEMLRTIWFHCLIQISNLSLDCSSYFRRNIPFFYAA
ncbi:dna-directed rna polymerases iv and v subunit 2 [Quercus suber]|uniref:Dna-directed rna polymerases iv and v subunit 2 n=1 Tax=Quercus suber TaxID=58331 RepID=A0AAW0LZ38_QUESU